MKNQLLSSVAIVTAAFGTSLVVVVPAAAQPVVYDWRGFYLGGHIGYGEARFPTVADVSDLSRGNIVNKPSGVAGGAHLGYNWQINSFVLGLEADIDATNWNERRFFGTAPRSITNDVNLMASLRGRLGLAFDRALIYFTGGFGYSNAKFLARSPGGTETDGKFRKWGGVLGGGLEWKLNPSWSIRGEGLWYKFGPERRFGTDHIWRHEYKDAWMARGGLTFHFN